MRSLAIAAVVSVLSSMIVVSCQDRSGTTTSTGTSTESVPPRDISGVWLGPGPAPELEPTAPMTPAGQALFDAAKPMYGPRAAPVAESNDPLVTCDPLGFPRSVLHELRGIEFVQTPNKVLQLLQYQRTFREIWTDGRMLPKDVGTAVPGSADPRWYGYSIGRWEDDSTFVIETVGAPETTWGDEYGHPHGLGGRVEERYRRIDRDTLEQTVTITDPEMYEEPFVASRQMLKRGTELEEQLCVPSEAQQYLELVAKPAVTPK
jgi:hypothetical protein